MNKYDQEYWARRHYDPDVARQHDERWGESARGLTEANIRTEARLALMTPEEREANDASALRKMGEYCCPKHLTGADRESWIAARTAHIHAMRAGTAELWDFYRSGRPDLSACSTTVNKEPLS